MRIGELPREAGEKYRRQDENADGERDQRPRIGRAETEEDERRQQVADEIIVEGGKELAPEEPREPPAAQKRKKHAGP